MMSFDVLILRDRSDHAASFRPSRLTPEALPHEMRRADYRGYKCVLLDRSG